MARQAIVSAVIGALAALTLASAQQTSDKQQTSLRLDLPATAQSSANGVFSPDSRLLAYAGERSVSVFEAGSGHLLWSRPMDGLRVPDDMAFSPDGTWLAVASATHRLYVLSGKTGEVGWESPAWMGATKLTWRADPKGSLWLSFLGRKGRYQYRPSDGETRVERREKTVTEIGFSGRVEQWPIFDVASTSYDRCRLYAADTWILNAAYSAHPERFVRRPPQPLPAPTEVWINKPQQTPENIQ